MKILVTLSGGLDSVGVLYKALTDPAYQDYGIVVHHVHFINRENRAHAEHIAVENVLNYFKSRPDQYRQLEYSESVLQVPETETNGMFDSDATSFIASYICRITPEIKEVHYGTTASDSDGSPMREQYLTDRKRIGATMVELFAPSVKRKYLVNDMTKKEIFDMLPPELSAMAWSCRTPIYDEGTPLECGQCKTCQQMSEIRDLRRSR